MAKQTAGFMGGFHGRLGPAVGYMWRGQWCVRSYNPYPRNPRTEAQVAHREMFKREVQLAASMSWAVNLGLKELAYDMRMTSYNLFVHLNQHAFSLVERDRSGANQPNEGGARANQPNEGGARANQPNEGGAGVFTVDYSTLRLSSGPLEGVTFGAPQWDEDNVLTVTFDRNGSGQRGDNFDHVYLYAYCPDIEDGFMASPVYRRAKKVSVALPDIYKGHELHLYGLVCNDEGVWSETVYAGNVELGMRDEALGEPTELAEGAQAGVKRSAGMPSAWPTTPVDTTDPRTTTTEPRRGDGNADPPDAQ